MESPSNDKLHFAELPQDDEFKNNVCYPYFRDIYIDLCSRSDNQDLGINKVSMIEYAGLPGILGERFFSVLDTNTDGYLDYKEFMTGLIRIYCSNFDEKIRFVFEIYDFDKDGVVSKDDIHTVMSYMPAIQQSLTGAEGKISQEGGNATSYTKRLEILEEIYQTVDESFGSHQQINCDEFKKMNEEISSDTLLSVVNLLREKLPCSENFWRYKRNYDLHMQEFQKKTPEDQAAQPKLQLSALNMVPGPQKQIASPKMTLLKSLIPYQGTSPRGEQSFSASMTDGDSESITSQIPLDQFRSNATGKRDVHIQPVDQLPGFVAEQMSPSSFAAKRDLGFKNIENASMLSNAMGAKKFVFGQQEESKGPDRFCVCGLPALPGEDICIKCRGDGQTHIEGEILKKQKKGGVLKPYWFVLLGKELYSYKQRGDQAHKEMQSLVGVHIKNEKEEVGEDGVTPLYPFMLIFPNKRRIYYLKSEVEKQEWLTAIKKVIGYADLFDFYDFGDVLGQGKYGLVKKGIHKKTGKEVAIKIVKKKDLTLKDKEMLKREIEVLKVCQHPNIIQLEDIFENQDNIFIVMELLTGGDLFSYLEQRRFRLSEDRTRKLTHQISIALYYLHNFGIAHRDLKPENILMMDNSDDAAIKLVDFGLAKTLGPNETSNEAFGTLCYVAPEILLQRSYDKSVDLWSIGVLIHLMLSGTLPFDSEDDREIARKTIYNDVSFAHPIWNTISVQAKDLIVSLLQKDRTKRATLTQVLEHPWILKGNQRARAIRRNSSGNKLAEVLAYTHLHDEAQPSDEQQAVDEDMKMSD